MTTGMNVTIANSILDAYARSVAWAEPAELWVKLHTGDPGTVGTSNPAANATRQEGTFANATGGTITTNADCTWTSVSTTETYAYVSFWDASTSGVFLGSDALETSRGVTAGDNFTIAAGDLDLSITPVAGA
jgi:hypothetical protein